MIIIIMIITEPAIRPTSILCWLMVYNTLVTSFKAMQIKGMSSLAADLSLRETFFFQISSAI